MNDGPLNGRENNAPESAKINIVRPDILVESLEIIFHDLTKISKSRHTLPAEIAPEGACNDTKGGGSVCDPVSKSHLRVVLRFPGLLDLASQHGRGLGGLRRRLGIVERLVDGRRADRRRHERISSDYTGGNDRGRFGAESGAWSIALYDTALFGGIASEEAALNGRANTRAEVGDNVRELETLIGSAGGEWLGGGRSGRGGGYLLDRVVAGIANDVRTLFMLGRSHGDEEGQKHR